ncbi:ubiquitin carboxyl-terminal hydrolase 32 isoform X2 [Condylostylus longicornis]|uniref:ubiquitin carboxyl-terminal hydrolase 32 isoform X2 n=1 Tax=Condylostylus longicornis TaxID=2530218 RepID=UPI00244E42E2|nr:ubiquitin carboxyl-terminal hydrolase 32 isoform X2 [Condylostylus longicornis]
MGAKESKPPCIINYEEALKRVSDAEAKRIKEAFIKSTGPGIQYLSQSAFKQDVLCEKVPPLVAEWIYIGCGGTSKGILFKDLFCALVLLTRGKDEEKIRFLWNLYSNEAGSYILKSDYTKYLNLELNAHSKDLQKLTNTKDVLSLFSQSERVTFDQFKEWIVSHKNSTVLSKWLLSQQCLCLTSELETPTFYQSLAGVTHLEEQDIGHLEKEFWRLKSSSLNNQLDLDLLGPLLSPPIPKTALRGFFNAFDENCDGHIDFKELCCGVSAACRGPNVERSKFCFKIFDLDRDSLLNFNEVNQMIDILMFVARESSSANDYERITKNNVLNDLIRFVRKKDSNQVSEHAEDLSSSLTLTQEDFMMWNVESSLNLVRPFLDLTFEICHIIFGIPPQCRHMEYEIVRGWLNREDRRGHRVGQFWYLISKDWWNSWVQYTQTFTIVPCIYCKASSNLQPKNISISSGCVGTSVDEALVCDESFSSNVSESVGDLLTNTDNSSLGSGSSGISYGKYTKQPGPIDNTNLIIPNPFKSIHTLTGEGGHLKKDTPLIQGHDFELVPKSLWDALARWYTAIVPLPRQVIQPPNSPDVELELYPLNLRILLHQIVPMTSQTIPTWNAMSGGYGAIASGGAFVSMNSASNLQPPKRYLAYTAAFSRLATVKLIGEFLCDNLKLKYEDIRLWHISNSQNACDDIPVLLDEETMTLEDLYITDKGQLLLEIRNKDLTWPEELGSLAQSASIGSHVQDRRMTRASIHSMHVPGATGLHNLGNTCFMNAALQVLFNTAPLSMYFKKNMHVYELNTANKLGTKGQLATRYAELLKEIWTSTTRSVAPLKLRFCVTKFAPQFAGGGQHDSQELLEWMLDGLHEDLNRVTEKPYTELKDSNGRPDEEVAHEAWTLHHSRNQSIVIDLFYGQLKSKVSCLRCGKESVRFDPFSLLSLPLPVENYIYFEILVIFLDGGVPTKYGIRLNSDSTYYDIKKEVSNLCHLNPNLMLLCQVANSQIKIIFHDEQKFKSTTPTELHIYQLPEDNDDNRSRTSSILGVNIEKGLKDIQRSPALLIASDNQQTSHQQNNQLQTQSSTTIAHFNNQSIPQNSYSSNTTDETTAIDNSFPATFIEQTEIKKSSKVRRCFGNTTMCMPQTLLCFKQSIDISTSPESSFVHNLRRKRISTTNLLSDNTQMFSYSSDEGTTSSIEKGPTLSRLSHLNNVDLEQENGVRQNTFVEQNPLRNENIIITRSNCKRISNNSDSDDSNHSINSEKSNKNLRMNYIKNETNSFDENETDVQYRNIVLERNLHYSHAKIGKYLVAVHRKLNRQDAYFLSYHKTRPNLFGVPLLIPCYENATNKDLYCAVWVQVNRLLTPLPPTPDQSNHAADCDDSLGYDFPFTLSVCTYDGKTCALCPWSNFCHGCEIPCNDDFILQGQLQASSACSSNSSTPKLSHKVTSIPSFDPNRLSPVESNSINLSANNIYIAIDWDPTALHLRYQSTREKIWVDHESIDICKREQSQPVDLDHCLRAFTSEEKLEQWYHCSHCKAKTPATKKLQIWRLPPILIIHLKRFNFVNNKWVKSHANVSFPFDNFDPTPYLASVPQETILRHNDLKIFNYNDLRNSTCNEDDNENDDDSIDIRIEKNLENDLNEFNNIDSVNSQIKKSIILSNKNDENVITNEKDATINKITQNIDDNIIQKTAKDEIQQKINSYIEKQLIKNKSITVENKKSENNSEESFRKNNNKNNNDNNKSNNNNNNNNNNNKNNTINRKRLISTSLVKTPVIDGQFKDYHHHKLKEGADALDLKYKLYAVVSHSGMLNGGHYVSYAANPNGNWYCFNDSSCREIPKRPDIDPSSSYLLFYERKHLEYEPYLPNCEGRIIPNGNVNAIELDDSENDLKKMCILS